MITANEIVGKSKGDDVAEGRERDTRTRDRRIPGRLRETLAFAARLDMLFVNSEFSFRCYPGLYAASDIVWH
jgi:hypothetical protein